MSNNYSYHNSISFPHSEENLACLPEVVLLEGGECFSCLFMLQLPFSCILLGTMILAFHEVQMEYRTAALRDSAICHKIQVSPVSLNMNNICDLCGNFL